MKKISLFVIAALILATGCDSYEQQNEFTEQALAETPHGYTRTNEDGAITDSSEFFDEEDWRTAPDYAGIIVEPAYPNPAVTGPVYLPVTVTFPDIVQGQLVLCAFDANDDFFLIDSYVGADFTINSLNQFSVDNQLVRVFVMEAPAGASFPCQRARNVVSYGDVLIR